MTPAQATQTYELPTCKKCGDEYFLHEGCEATDYCDSCAQELVPDLLEALEAYRAVHCHSKPFCAKCRNADEVIRKAKKESK